MTVAAASRQSPFPVGSAPVPRLRIARSPAPEITPQNYVPRSRVKVNGKPGMLLGHNSKGQAIVSFDAPKGHVREKWVGPFSSVTAIAAPGGELVTQTGRAAREAMLLEGVDPSRIHQAPRRLMKAVLAAMDQPVVQQRTARSYVQALMRAEHPVMLVGGGVRDALRALETTPGISDGELLKLLHDIDLSTTASPDEIIDLCGSAGRFSKPNSAAFGFIGFGARKEGLDISALHFGLAHEEGGVLGRRLMDDVGGRDFTANQLYLKLELDELKQLDGERAFLVDPTGRGIKDAKANRLRIGYPRQALLNPSLPFRYLKFRERGMTTDPQTCEVMLDSCKRHLPRLSNEQFVRQMLRIKPADIHTRDQLRPLLLEFMEIAKADGIGGIVHEHLFKRRQLVYDTLERYYPTENHANRRP